MAEYERLKGHALEHINNVEKIVTEAILSARGKKYKKSLGKKDREGIEKISFAVASNIDWLIPINLETVQDIIKRYPRMNSRAAEIYNQMSQPNMTLGQRKEIMAGAITIYDMEENRFEMGL